jgi:hypothetical protein
MVFPKMIRKEKTEAGQVIGGHGDADPEGAGAGPMHGYGVAEWIEQTSPAGFGWRRERSIRRCTGELRGLLSAIRGFGQQPRAILSVDG